jgi:phage FluMu protein Com
MNVVDCPTCGILIAVPPEMQQFQCPRCSTICSAPPKYAVPPPPPPPAKRNNQAALSKLGGGGRPPVSASSLADEVRRKRQLRMDMEARAQAAASGLPALPSAPSAANLEMGTIRVAGKDDTKSGTASAIHDDDDVAMKTLTTKEDQYIHQVCPSCMPALPMVFSVWMVQMTMFVDRSSIQV